MSRVGVKVRLLAEPCRSEGEVTVEPCSSDGEVNERMSME